MAKFYPNLKNIKENHIIYEEGEIFFLEKMEKYLNDDYEIYFQSHLNNSFPDIIIMRKERIIMIIEIKDWKLNQYYSIASNGQWKITTGKGECNIKSPFDQVKYYKDNLVNYYTSLFEKKIKDKNKYGFIKEYVYFHNETQKSFNKFLRNNQYELDENKRYLTRDSLDSKESFFEILDKIFIGNKKTNYFLEDIYSELKLILNPPKHLKEDGIEIHYSKEQKKFIESKIGEYKIQGVVGSGKTTVLAKRAVNAHKRHKEQILILYFNITVGNYIRDKISKVREEFSWENFKIIHFHKFIGNEKNRIGSIESDISIEEVLNKLSQDENIKKYKTIIIDEVQDFEKIWIQELRNIYLDNFGEFVVFGDEKQNIYKKNNIDEKKLSVPIKGNWGKLNYSFRLPEKMTKLAEEFQKNYLEEFYECDKFETRQMVFDFQEFKFEYSYFSSKTAEDITMNNLYKKIIELIKKYKLNLEDICILTKGTGLLEDPKNFILEFQDYMTKKGMAPNSIFEKLSDKRIIENEIMKNMELEEEKKKERIKNEISRLRKGLKFNFRMSSPNIKISTIHSFKGWEVDTIIYFIFNELHPPEEVYTAITRAKQNLIIFNFGNLKYHNFFKKYKE